MKLTTEKRNQLTTWIPLGLFSAAAIINASGAAPIWLFLAFMVPGLIVLAIGFFDMQRQWRRIEKTVEETFKKEPDNE